MDEKNLHGSPQDADAITIGELEDYLAELEDQLTELECSEPDEIDEDEYADWEDRMAELESLIADVEDQLDDLQS